MTGVVVTPSVPGSSTTTSGTTVVPTKPPININLRQHPPGSYGITISEQRDHPKDGYKRYNHSFANRKIGTISYDGVPQNGLDDINKDGYTGVSVFYFKHDEDNLIPLLVGLTKGQEKYEYYKKDNYLDHTTHGEWKNKGELEKDKLVSELNGIAEKLKELIVIKLDAKKDEGYRINGETTSEINSGLKIYPYPQNSIENYNRMIHTITGTNSERLLSTRNAAGYIPFKDPEVYKKICSEAYTYYWKEDALLSNPLLLELKSGDSTYYKLVDDGRKKWKYDKTIATDLTGTLNGENVKYNYSHCVNIYKNTGNSYDCSTCINPTGNISLESTDLGEYRKCTHCVSSGKFNQFSTGSKGERRITITTGVDKVFVFHHPPNGSNPLLVYIPEGTPKWYHKKNGEWKPVTHGAPIDDNDANGIKALLKPVGHYKDQHHPTLPPPSYTVPSQGAQEKFEEPSSGNPGLIAAGVIVGILLVGFATYEIYMMRKQPTKSLIMKVVTKCKKQN